jgi:hypothetical protein
VLSSTNNDIAKLCLALRTTQYSLALTLEDIASAQHSAAPLESAGLDGQIEQQSSRDAQ